MLYLWHDAETTNEKRGLFESPSRLLQQSKDFLDNRWVPVRIVADGDRKSSIQSPKSTIAHNRFLLDRSVDWERITTMEEDKASSEAPTTASGKKKKVGQPSAAEETASPYPDMDLCQEIHQLTVKAHNVDADFQTKVFKEVAIELENPSLYSLMQSKLGVDGGVLSESARLALEEKHKKHLEELEAKVEEAKENAGDMEVMDARVEIAKFAAKSLTKEQALESYKKLLDLPKISSGKKIDALMESSRVASFYGDASKSAEMIDSVSKQKMP